MTARGRNRSRPQPRRVLTIAPVIALVGALVTSACGDDAASGLAGIELPALVGDATLDLGEVDGPAVLNVWATWCQPCVRELPAFERASGERQDVRFLGIDATGLGDVEASVEYLAELGVTYEQYVDRDGAFSEELRITELPATVIVDADGDVAVTHQGELSYAELDDLLAEL